MLTELNYDEWIELFNPLVNHIDSNASYNGAMFDTYGKELKYLEGIDPNCIWTLSDCDGEMFIHNGWGFVNRMGYFITSIPFNPKEDYQVYVSYDKEYDENWLPCDECGEHNMDWNMSPNNNLMCNNCEDEMVEVLNA